MKWTKNERTVGYVLLVIGLILMFFSIYEMLSVFTGASPPPKLFSFSDIYFPAAGEAEPTLMMTGEGLNRMAAMGFWYILMFFIMWAGGKIASLGVNLIKEVKTEVREPLKKTAEKEAEKTEGQKES